MLENSDIIATVKSKRISWVGQNMHNIMWQDRE